jgi:hypothetical protein
MKILLAGLLLLQTPSAVDRWFAAKPVVFPPQAEYRDFVKNGVYTAMLVDPNNEWRCAIVGVYPGPDVRAFTVACMKRSEVEVER